MSENKCPSCNKPLQSCYGYVDGNRHVDVFECGSKKYRDSQILLDQTQTCMHNEAITEAWRIINVYLMESLDNGDSWSRATTWLDKWENYRPNDLRPIRSEQDFKLMYTDD